MSRSSHHHRQMQAHQQQQQLIMAEHDAAALATEIFDHFCAAITMRQILGLYRNMCDTIGLRPGPLNDFYPKLKSKIRSWKAQALWKKFDARAVHRCYSKGSACTGTRVLVIGAGPCGLRTAIEAQLLGAKVVVVEKRDRVSRNNVLHLWPYLITDLRNLGAKKFYGKFCAGSIDHISIRQLQCILLKVALLLGVEVHEGVSFENTVEPSDGCGWRAQVSPEDHAVSHYEFDVLIGADGKRNTLEGFRRKEFRGKLAIAITANFINKKTEAEAKVEEISGVAFIFNQSFFKELYQTTGIDLENIVYYKDETHYFVMTAKKHSLIDKGVIMQDFADPAELLAPANVNTEKLLDYAKEAAEFSTKYQMPNLEFAVNHYGKPDVAMFDFTSMFAAEASCHVIVRKNYRLLQCLVGDSLLEPFWPTGSGCARGFLSSMDAAYAIKLWSNPRNSILGVIAQRESIYRLLAQTTPENLQRDIGAYTVDPGTRYPNLNKSTVNVWQVKHLLDTDDQTLLEQTFMDTNLVQTLAPETPIRRKRRTGDTLPLSTVLLRWIKAQLQAHEFAQDLNELSECFTGGKVLCTLINRYRPDLVDLNTIKDYSVKERNELAFKILEAELGIPRVMTAKDSLNLENVDSKIWLNYLEQICEVFRGEIPHVKHPKLDFFELKERTASNKAPDFSHLFKANAKKSRSPMQDIDMGQTVHRRSILDEEKIRKQRKYGPDFNPVPTDTSRRAKKRRSQEKTGNIEDRQKRLAEIEQNRLDRQSKRRLHRFQQTQNFYKSLHMLQANTFLRESDGSSPFEDYSLYMYRQQAPGFSDRVKDLERKLLYPDRERGIASAMPRGNTGDEQFSDRIKSMEQKITSRNAGALEKKPKDLLRAIGKIESTDWNVREIEKKIEQSKRTETGKSKEKVPKWSKEQFLARQHKMAKADRQQSVDEKFKDIDQTLKTVDKQLKDGALLEVGERGKNKVASIAGQFVKKDDHSDEKSVPIQKSSSKVGLVFNKQGASEKCHFCKQTVYLMEKISTEGLVLHRSCLKCHHCHTNLRLGAYAFDRDDPVGRFYCTQHFRLPAKAVRPVVRKSMKNQNKQSTEATNTRKPDEETFKTPDHIRNRPENVAQMDLLDRGQTPERIEFENVDAMSDGEPSQEHIIDENEWTDRNFITEDEDAESNISDSDSSDDDSESDYEEANESPLGAQTLQLATDWIGKQRHSYMDDDSDGDFYDSSEGMLDDDDADSQTEGEEFKKARELRKQEVTVLPPPQYLLTDTETEVVPKDVVEQQNTNNDNDRESKNSNYDNLSTDNIDNENAPTNVNDKSDIQTNLTAISDTNVDKNLHTDTHENENNDKKETESSENSLKRNNRDRKLVNARLPSGSSESINSGGSLVSLKNEIKRIDNKSAQPTSSGIDALSENLYNLNNLIKLQRDVDSLKRENVVKNDIMKKLSLKEQWINQDTSGTILHSVHQALRESTTDLKDPNAQEEKCDEKLKEITQRDEFSKPGLETNTPKNEVMAEDILADPDTEELEIEKLVINAMDEIKDDLNKTKIPESSARDLGKVFYNLENSDRKMSKTLKNIEVKNFADTMDSIKSQITTPNISKQSSVDLSKYFPNQKQEKAESAAANKNQKPLKDVNLSKYFSQSPNEARKDNKTKPATMVTPSSPVSQKRPVPLELFGVTSNGKASSKKRPAPKKPTNGTKGGVESNTIDQLDGAVDISQRKNITKNPLGVSSSGAVKRRIKPNPPSPKSYQIVKLADLNPDSDEEIFEEILHENCSRPSSTEYRRLFEEEKSPSEDISDKIEKLLEEEVRVKQKDGTGNPRKKLTKTRIVGSDSKQTKPNTNQKLLARQDSKGETVELLTDLEKTMAFLRDGWKTEASRFLENKRDSFFAKRKNGHVEEAPTPIKSVAKSSITTKARNASHGMKKKPEKQSNLEDEFSSVTKKYFAKKTQVPIGWKRRERSKANEASSSHAHEPRPMKQGTKKEENKPRVSLHQKYEMLLEERLSSDLSDLSVDVSDKEIDKILDELAQDLEELKEIESKLERKQSLPDVVKSGKLAESVLHEADGSKWTGSLENTREELDLLEKGEIARRASLGGAKPEENTNEKESQDITQQTDDQDWIKDDAELDQGATQEKPYDNVAATNLMEPMDNHNNDGLDDSAAESERKIDNIVINAETEPVAQEDIKSEDGATGVYLEHEQIINSSENENSAMDDHYEKDQQADQIRSPPSDRILPRDRKSSSGSLSLSFSYSATSDSGNDKTSIFMENEHNRRMESSKTGSITGKVEPSSASSKKNSREATVTSDEDSVDALLNQLTDDMLVGIEFDSNDEFVRIIPQGKLNNDGIDASKMEDDAAKKLAMSLKPDSADSIKYFEICGRDSSSGTPDHFPTKPVRRNKSISSSSTPDIPIVPVRVRKFTLPKLNPVDMAPSVQDVLKKVASDCERKPEAINRIKGRSESFPIKCIGNEDKRIVNRKQPVTSACISKEVKSQGENKNQVENNFAGESDANFIDKSNKQQTPTKSNDVTFDNRQAEDAYIEQLEKERRAALRRRDEAYAKENSTLAVSIPITADPVKSDDTVLSSSPLKSSYSSIPPSISSSHDSTPFASTQDLTIPQRPPRRRSLTHNNDEPVDVNTHYLLERSKMLHDRKQNFMNEKIAGNNPYLKQMIDEEKRSQEHLDSIGYHDSSIDSVELRHRPSSRSHHRFPTLRSLHSDRDRERHGSSESIEKGPKTYSIASTLGPRNFVEYFKRTPPKHADYRRDTSKDRRDPSKERRGNSKDSCVVQTDSESSSPDDVGLNSATEISTDSEFDHDPIYRDAPPRIFIDDTHIRKPTRVQVRQGVIGNHTSQRLSQINNQQQQQFLYKQPEIEFKPLVQVDPSVLSSNRTPLKNPRTGDYLLSKAPSTEGIASRKSLELKKRYLLGEQGIGNGIMKSGSTSILDTKLKSFHSNITECQKLLNPSSDISPRMKTFLEASKIGVKGTESSLIFDIEKKSSDEKENVFVNSQNALNKEKELVESVNGSLVDNKERKPGSGKVCSPIIETIDLISPEKSVPIIDLTETPSPKTEKNEENRRESVVDLTVDTSPEKESNVGGSPMISERPDVSKDAKEKIPDIITHIEERKVEKRIEPIETNNEINDTCIEVPTVPWNTKKQDKSDIETDSLSNSSTSSLEDIPHFILDSTTSPDTQNGVEQIVPRVEIHDTKGNLMQIDSLMIIDGKYVGDPDDLAHMEIPKGVTLPEEQKRIESNEPKTNTTIQAPRKEEPKEPVESSKIVESIRDGSLIYSSIKPDLKFDTRNENKVDTLKNIPLVLEKDETQRPQKPVSLILAKSKSEPFVDKDKTPTAVEPTISDSETEITGQVLTETELSDWTADDAVSENFVDIEFALNSNRGTIKRNRKHKKKLSPPKTTSPHKALENRGRMMGQNIEVRCGNLPNQQKSDCSILKNLNIEEIEFMDTGSEGSCAETYSATNRAMLHNRGYIQIIEHLKPIEAPNLNSSDQSYLKGGMYLQSSEKSNEIEGVDYIEQGACILNNDIDLKTPVNETPPLFTSKPSDQVVPATQPQSETTNDLDDDSLMYINSQGTGTGTTTTEESDMLTVVVSPLESSHKLGDEPSPSQAASSSDKNEKTTSNSSAISKTPVRKSSDERNRQSMDDPEASAGTVGKKRDSEDISYEEYVRKLQMKITQISNARDSLDIRKQRRKSSKGSGTEIMEGSAATTQNNSVIENDKNLSIYAPTIGLESTTNTPEQTTNGESAIIKKIDSSDKPEIPTVTKKLEEITKERTKQKDLIHDLVMDKLQSKKQLNLEKRLIRNRNRTLVLGIAPSPPPKVSSDYQCANTPHYHIASAERRNSKSSPSIVEEKDTKPSLSASPSKQLLQSEQTRFNNRPLSDNLERPNYPPKITKTQSFCVYSTRYLPLKDGPPKSADAYKSANTFVTPHPPPRAFRKLDDTSISATTEKLRAEARARARLKSNEDLGLSPEEKLQILRKRYHLDLQQALEGTSTNKSDDMKVHERKMVTSKSFNDITAAQELLNSNENLTSKPTMQMSDCTSDPNINNSSSLGDAAKTPTLASRRRKDPERRKSLIQAVSNFFHKRKEKEGSPSTPASPKNDKGDSVFSRFKISPKAGKEKSKDRDESSSCERNKTREFLKNERLTTHSSSPQLYKKSMDDLVPPPIPPLPLNYQRSDDESYTPECREQKKQRAISKASRQAELKRLRIAQEIQREQEEIEVKLKELEARGVLIEKALRGEGQDIENLETSSMGASDEKLLKELLEIWRNITQLKKRDEELGIRQKELQLEHRHAQLKEELNSRLSCSKLDKTSADIAAEGAILNEMLEIVAKRAALRPSESSAILRQPSNDNHSDI